MTVARVLDPDVLARRDRGGGIATVPLVTGGIGATAFMNGVTILAPGAAVPRHWHNCDESVLVLAGDAVADLAGVDHPLRPGQVSFIPAGVPHGFRNPSRDRETRIFWTYGAIDADRTDAATGTCRSIAAEHGAAGD